MNDLTMKQRETLDYIKEFVRQKGYQPTEREIALSLGVSHVSIHSRLVFIEKKGYIQMTGERRSIRILK